MQTLRKVWLSLLTLTVLSAPLLAQGSGSTRSGSYGDRDAYQVTRSVVGTLKSLSDQGKTFAVIDEESGRTYSFNLGEKTKLKADKKVLGKKEISWSDLKEGQRVKVRYVESTREVVELKLLPQKEIS